MSFFKKLKSSKHFPLLNKKKESMSSLVEDLNLRHLIVYHIDSETEGNFSLTVRNDDNGDLVLLRVCDHYNLHDYKEYFGLKYSLLDERGDHEIYWLDPLKLVGKQLKDTNNVLTFRVKHFPGKPNLIQSEYVRYLMFLQIRNYLLKGDLQLALTEETRLAAFAIQASIGDYDDIENKATYLADIKFLSQKTKSEEMIMEFHKELKGKLPGEMEMEFLEKASQFYTYGAELIVVKTSKGVQINFGASHNGIITFLYGMPANSAKIDMFPWSQIGKISYEGRTLRVHFHTPDQDNSEIIKKHVMVFKCNSNRICKHLWKFVLEQKSFFNFKRGVDVPKMKSSDRLFTFKSKFRYSGRCESELISAQHDTSFLSISSNEKSLDYSTLKSNGMTSSLISNGTNGTLKSTTSFKRRTFLTPPRSTFIRVKNIDLNSKRDSNNNSIETFKCIENSSFNNTVKINETVSLKSHETIIEKSELSETNQSQLKQPPTETAPETNLMNLPVAQATSTPTMNTRKCELLNESRQSSVNMLVNKQSNESTTPEPINDTQETAKVPVFTIHNDDDDQTSDDDHFYDHEERILKRNTNSRETSMSNGDLSYHEHTMEIKPQSKWKNIRYTLCIILIVLFVFFLFLFLIQHWKCKLSSDIDNENNIIKVNLNSCGYQKTLSRLSDNLNLFLQELFNLVYLNTSSSRNRKWIPWPMESTQHDSEGTTRYDPLFFWFFKQYQEN